MARENKAARRDLYRKQHLARLSWKALLRLRQFGEAEIDLRWQSFEDFFAALGERSAGTLLSRHDLDGGYTQENCFWEARHSQIRRLAAKANSKNADAGVSRSASRKNCTKCKQEKSLDDFYTNKNVLDLRHSRCKLCSSEAIRTYYFTHPVKHMLARACARARNKGLEFALQPEDLEPLPTHCPVFGIKLTRGNGHQDPAAFSLDRTDNKKGYVRGNVVVMSYLANRLKNDGTAEQHARIAEWMRGSLAIRSDGLSAGMLF